MVVSPIRDSGALRYADDGDRDSTYAAVALHSIGADHRLWSALVPTLTEQTGRALRPDTRGHGASDWPGTASLTGWVRDLDDVLEHAGVEQIDLLGVSMGGIQAMAYAAYRPERVRSLVVLDSFARLEPSETDAKIEALAGMAQQFGMAAFAEKYVSDTVLDKDSPASVDLRDAIAGMPIAAFEATVEACFTADVLSVLPEIPCRSLVLWGELDQKTTRHQSEQIASGLPDARLATIAGAGHLPMVDTPTELASQLRTFSQDGPRGRTVGSTTSSTDRSNE